MKDSYNDIIYIGQDIDSDPWVSVKNIDKYKDVKFITIGDKDSLTEGERFNYMMLARLQSDCEYYLGNGNKFARHLWGKNEDEQIKEMKRIYNGFTKDKKPKWLTMAQILEYEKQMLIE
jgi:hypothetical protein